MTPYSLPRKRRFHTIEDPLANARRAKIYGLIQERPGVTIMDVARSIGTPNQSPADKHLYVLERLGLVRSEIQLRGRRVRAYFPIQPATARGGVLVRFTWALLGLGVLVLTGCVDRSPVFVPACDADAPSRLEMIVPGGRRDATLYKLEALGWSNVTRLRHGAVGADCPAGTRDPVLIDFVEMDEADARQEASLRRLIAWSGPIFFATGTVAAAPWRHRLAFFLPALTSGYILAWALGVVPVPVPILVGAASVVILVIRYSRPTPPKEGGA